MRSARIFSLFFFPRLSLSSFLLDALLLVPPISLQRLLAYIPSLRLSLSSRALALLILSVILPPLFPLTARELARSLSLSISVPLSLSLSRSLVRWAKSRVRVCERQHEDPRERASCDAAIIGIKKRRRRASARGSASCANARGGRARDVGDAPTFCRREIGARETRRGR